ncbi:MAG TPA: hypothetical protein VKP69_32400 [Isosphaeraceae bacterium]|nr:hypothetical protein [Isosphaeraceae bacterium]
MPFLNRSPGPAVAIIVEGFHGACGETVAVAGIACTIEPGANSRAGRARGGGDRRGLVPLVAMAFDQFQ